MLVINYKNDIPQQRFYALGVRGNNKSNKIKFVVVRKQADIDLLGLACNLKVENKEHEYKDLILLHGVYKETTNTIEFVWEMTEKSTQFRSIELQLEFLGEEDVVWQTLIAELELNDTIKVGDEKPTDQELSALKQLEVEVNEQGNRITQNEEDIEELQEEIVEIGKKLKPITYNELKALRDSGGLVEGCFYRITDYQCTTSQNESKSAGHQFDIIVQAVSKNELSENAKAIKHEGDTYFENCKLETWELKYCLDNDTNRFAWALDGQAIVNLDSSLSKGQPLIRQPSFDGRNPNTDYSEYQYAWGTWEDVDDGDTTDFIYSKNPTLTNGEIVYVSEHGEYEAEVIEGKGVIYYMKDEWNNECPYDFKNILFRRYKVAQSTSPYGGFDKNYVGVLFKNGNFYPTGYNKVDVYIWAYTFTGCKYYGSEEVEYYDVSAQPKTLPQEVIENLKQGETWANVYDVCRNNKIARCFYDYRVDGDYLIEKVILNNIVLFGEHYYSGDVEDWDWGVSLIFDNRFGVNCSYNTLNYNPQSNSFGSECRFNTLDIHMSNNFFASKCSFNIMGGHSICNTLGVGCSNNTFGNNSNYNTLKTYCTGNTFSSFCQSNTFGDYCRNNTFGSSYSKNIFNSNCYNNTFGSSCEKNILGNVCQGNTFGNNCGSNTFGNDCSNNNLGNVFQHNTFGNDCSRNTFGNDCYRNTFGNGCSSNTFGNECQNNAFNDFCRSNTLEQKCKGNIFETEVSSNSLGQTSNSNIFGNSCNNNTCGHDFSNNALGNLCRSNIFGAFCYENTFGNNCENNVVGNFMYHCTFGNSVEYINANIEKVLNVVIENGCSFIRFETSETSDYLQNVHVHLGVKGASSTNPKVLSVARGNAFETSFKPTNSVEVNV